MALYARRRPDGIELLRDPPLIAGLLPVTEARPILAVNQYHGDPTYEVAADSVTLRYPVLTLEPTQVNAEALRSKADQALTANAAFLANGAPTVAQVTTQVQRLTRECSTLIRLLLERLDTTDGT